MPFVTAFTDRSYAGDDLEVSMRIGADGMAGRAVDMK
jgi:hypothetical protein